MSRNVYVRVCVYTIGLIFVFGQGLTKPQTEPQQGNICVGPMRLVHLWHDFQRQFLTWPTRLDRLAINAIACFKIRITYKYNQLFVFEIRSSLNLLRSTTFCLISDSCIVNVDGLFLADIEPCLQNNPVVYSISKQCHGLYLVKCMYCVLHGNIDQALVTILHGLLNCEIVLD